jgi:hypothetical protein
MATATGMADSGVANATYFIKVATPTFTPGSGTYLTAVSVTLADSTPGAAIYYTTDGSVPTTASTLYSGAILVTQTKTIRAIGVAGGMAPSDVASATYTIKLAAPTFGLAGGTYNTPQTVSISAPAGASIYYTLDGSTPTTSSTLYTGPVSVTQTRTIRAIAAASGMASSDVASATYTLQAATPTFDPPSRSFILPLSVTISSASPGVTIYYTTDGSTPTTSSTQYTGPVMVFGTTTIKAIAVRSGWSQSAVGSATYNFLGL